jgi:MarR family transcriptional regulator, organic hydroperoxide resistance regulator
MIDPVLHLTTRLREIAHALSVHSKYIQENYQITVPQLICLREIHKRGLLPLGALTQFLFLSNSTVTGIVDRLEKRGFVQRVRQSRDRRQIHVRLTPEGTAFIENAPDPLRELFVARLKAMAPGEFEKMLAAIDTLAAMMSSAEHQNTDHE